MQAILVIDKNPKITEELRAIFEEEGFRFFFAPDGTKVSTMLSKVKLVIVDIGSLGIPMDELSLQLKKIPNPPLLILASDGKRVSPSDLQGLGSPDVVMKPFDFDFLVDRIKELIRQQESLGDLEVSLDLDQERSKRIWILDDSRFDQVLYKKALAAFPPSKNFNCQFFGDGEEFFQFLLSHSADGTSANPEIIFLDISVPGRAGFEILEFIKGDTKLKAVPTVIFSGAGDEAYINRAKAMGADHYQVKPSSLENWCQIVAELLNQFAIEKAG